jgi:phosphatidylethanolamine-binding protein (PEBP) family uncharacterized protein
MYRAARLLAIAALTGCASTGGYQAVATDLPGLQVTLADTRWDGERIPEEGICSNFGGDDLSPPLLVRNIPAGANAIIVQFNNLDHPARARNGGNGSIGYWIGDRTATQLPPVTGYSVRLPDGAFIEQGARATGAFASQGYLAPCSGGKGHRYVADVFAVHKATGPGQTNRLLAEQRISLGRY